MEKVRCLIIGSGPAGYTAAIYTARAGLAPVVYAGLVPGGQLTTTSEVENFPGYPDGVSGTAMMDDLRRQAMRFGADVRNGEVTAIDLSARPFRATVDGGQVVEADSVIIATGATARYLGLPSERKFIGLGVSACAVCDGFFYRDQDVAVVGGGDSACEEALYLATLCRKVYLIVRKDFLRASKVMQERVSGNPRIEVLFGSVTREILGDESGVTGVRIANKEGVERDLAVNGFFLGIGHQPRTEIFRGQLALDPEEYILVGGAARSRTVVSTAMGVAVDSTTASTVASSAAADSFVEAVAASTATSGKAWGSTATSVAGVFAAGDVADPVYQQAITAAASGCRAAFDCEKFLLGA